MSWSEAALALELAVEDDEVLVPVGAMQFSLRCLCRGRRVRHLLGNHGVDLRLREAKRIERRYQAGIDERAVGHLHHVVRLLLHERVAGLGAYKRRVGKECRSRWSPSH